MNKTVTVPREVEFDEALNDLGWKMDRFLRKNGAMYDGRVFNNMKSFLRECIVEWIDSHKVEERENG